jgi:hypothetical protein
MDSRKYEKALTKLARALRTLCIKCLYFVPTVAGGRKSFGELFLRVNVEGW